MSGPKNRAVDSKVSPLEQALRDYLTLRQGLGHQLADAQRLLPSFVAFLEEQDLATITIDAVLRWCQQPTPVGGATVAPRRMTAARGFARYLAGIDPATEIPPVGLVPLRHQRPAPFLYTDIDITALLAAARALTPTSRGLTYYTLLGLLAATGMRIGEAIALDLGDIDEEQATLLIRESKFGKSRLVPLHPSTMTALQDYLRARDGFRQPAREPCVFVGRTGKRLIYQVVSETFRKLLTDTGVGADTPRRPRLHDLRHRFAILTLIDWYRSAEPVQPKLPVLSTYLGHREPSSTYWYLSAAPELLTLAAARRDQTRPGGGS
jgi:integrase/recombinase XerD